MDSVSLVVLSGRQRLAVTLAWALPALGLLAGTAKSLLEEGEITARGGVIFMAGLLWMLWLARRAWRELLLDLMRLVLARTGWIPVTLVAVLVTVLTLFNSLGGFWIGFSGSLWLAAAVAASLAFSADRRRFCFQTALVLLNVGLVVLADLLIGALILPHLSHNKLFIQHDPYLGWRLRPGPPVKRVHPEYVSVETVNSWGFRTPEIPIAKPDGMKRILLVGDSHTEGYTVSDDETCARLIEQNLAGTLPVQVISLGVGGFSTDQEFLSYVHYGRRLQPDVVLLLFCVNDLASNVTDKHGRSLKPLFEQHGDMLMLTRVPVPEKYSTGLFSPELLRKSALVSVVEGLLGNLAIRLRERHKATPEQGWDMTRLVLRDFARMVRSDGARLVAMNVNSANPGLDGMDQRLRTILAEFSIPYLETAAAYRDDFESYWVAGHWNQKGQRAVADILTPQLLTLLQSNETGIPPGRVPTNSGTGVPPVSAPTH